MRNQRSGRMAARHSGFGNPVTPAARTYTNPDETVSEARYEEIAPPIYTGPLPTPPEGIAPPIYTGPLPVVPTGPQIQPPRPPRPTGGTRPPRPQPTGGTRPPNNSIPHYGQLPQLNLNMRPDQSLGVGDCLAPSSAVYAPQMEQFIRQELGLYQSFSNWADRYPQRSGILRELAAENLERARILLRAYSFITDAYYWPTYLRPTVSLSNFTREMRQLYSAVTQLERSYLQAYRTTADACLATVYLNLADRATSQRQRMGRVL